MPLPGMKATSIVLALVGVQLAADRLAAPGELPPEPIPVRDEDEFTAGPMPGSPWPNRRFTFAGVPWLCPADSVARRLTTRGYTEDSKARMPRSRRFHGTLFDRSAFVEASLDEQGRLVRWDIMVVAKDEQFPYLAMRKIYDDAKTEMTQRYGSPRADEDKYRFPYQRGDGREPKALRDGLARIRSEWRSRGGDRVRMRMDSNLSVVLSYSGPEWRALTRRVRGEKARDL